MAVTEEPLLLRLQEAVEEGLAEAIAKGEPGLLPPEARENIAVALESVLKDGLEGNRAVKGSVWAVLEALARAYPLQLAPTVDAARQSVALVPCQDDRCLLQAWMDQVLSGGKMMEYLGKLRNQPHIQGAYRKGCIMRTPAAIARLAEILSPLEGAKFSPEHKQQQQQEDEEQEAMGETLPGGDGQADGLGPGEAIVGLQVAANEDSAAPGPFLGADKAGWQAQAERWQRSLALRTSQVAAAAGQIIAEGIAALPIKENAPSRPGACAWPAEAGLGSAQGSPEPASTCRTELLAQHTGVATGELSFPEPQPAARKGSSALSGDPGTCGEIEGGGKPFVGPPWWAVELLGRQDTPGEEAVEAMGPCRVSLLVGEGGRVSVQVLAGQRGEGRVTFPPTAAPRGLQSSVSGKGPPGWVKGLFRRRSNDGSAPEGREGQRNPCRVSLLVGSMGHVRVRLDLEGEDVGGGASLAEALRAAAEGVVEAAVADGMLAVPVSSPKVVELVDRISQMLEDGLRHHPLKHQGPLGFLQKNCPSSPWEFLLAVERGLDNAPRVRLGCQKIHDALRGHRQHPSHSSRCLHLWLLHSLERRSLHDNISAVLKLPRRTLLTWYERTAVVMDEDSLGPFMAMLAGLGVVDFDTGAELDGIRDELDAGVGTDGGNNPLENPVIQGALNAVGGLINNLTQQHKRPEVRAACPQESSFLLAGPNATASRSHQESCLLQRADALQNDAAIKAEDELPALLATGAAAQAAPKVVAIGEGPSGATPRDIPSCSGRPRHPSVNLEDLLLSPPSSSDGAGAALLSSSMEAEIETENGLEPLPQFLPAIPILRPSSGQRSINHETVWQHRHVPRDNFSSSALQPPAASVLPPPSTCSGGAPSWEEASFGGGFLPLRHEIDSGWLSMGRISDENPAIYHITDWQNPSDVSRAQSPLLLSDAMDTLSTPSDQMSPAVSMLPSGVEEGDFGRLLSREFGAFKADGAGALRFQKRIWSGVKPAALPADLDARVLPGAGGEWKGDGGSDGTPRGDATDAVHEFVQGVFARILRDSKPTGGRPAGPRVKVALWVEGVRAGPVRLSLFIPQAAPPEEIPAEPLGGGAAAEQEKLSCDPEEELVGPSLVAGGALGAAAEGWARGGDFPTAAATDRQLAGGAGAARLAEADKAACLILPQAGASKDFAGVHALPRQPLPRSNGNIMGIALMEGYASVDTGTLSDMRDVLGGHTDSEGGPGGTAPWRPKWVSVFSAETREEDHDKEFTVYIIEVISHDGRRWNVEHRFRDFVALGSSLKLAGLSVMLPLCWEDISRARSVTGRHKLASEVVEARRLMLDRCLTEAISGPPALSSSAALLDFLSSQSSSLGEASCHPAGTSGKEAAAESGNGGEHHWSPVPWITSQSGAIASNVVDDVPSGTARSLSGESGFGSSVRLLLHLPDNTSHAELMRRQQGNCASCRKPIPLQKPGGFLSGLGIRGGGHYGPRRCEYSGRLYCPKCFGNATSIIPARVLHAWDFRPAQVSSIAAEYLASIRDQPMLCIGAINPGLYARVPLLARVHETRVRASKALDLALKHSGRSAAMGEQLLKASGPRRYLLESSEFWAMRELVELSKGAFSDLPGWLDVVSERARTIANSYDIINNKPVSSRDS